MKIKSSIITQASGSIGGLTASHNRGGLYLRARATPTNPNSSFQQVIRGAVAFLTAAWLDILSQAQRDAWDTYALQVPLPDRLGEPRNVGGLAMYVRSNTPRLQIGLPRVDDGPTTFDLGAYQTPSFFGLTAATQVYEITWALLDAWPNEDDAAMLLFVSRPQNASINYFKGPYRNFHNIPGDSAAPPAPPLERQVPFPFVEAQRLFVRYNVSRADGRLGAEGFATMLAAA